MVHRPDGVEQEMLNRAAESPAPPTFVIKADDAMAYPALVYYAQMCRQFGMEFQAHEASAAAEEFRVWQNMHPKKTHMPHHKYETQLSAPPRSLETESIE